MKKLITIAAAAAMCAALAAAPAFAHGGHNGGHGPHHKTNSVKITQITDAPVEAPSADSTVPAVKLRPARGQGCDFMTDEEKAKCEEIRAQLDELKAQYRAAETDEEKAAVLAEMKELAKDMPRMHPAVSMGHKGHHPHKGCHIADGTCNYSGRSGEITPEAVPMEPIQPETSVSESSASEDPGFEIFFDYNFDEII